MTARDELQDLLANAVFAVLDTSGCKTAEQTAAEVLDHLLETDTSWLINNGKVHKIEEVRDGWPDDGRYFWDLVTEQDEDDEVDP